MLVAADAIGNGDGWDGLATPPPKIKTGEAGENRPIKRKKSSNVCSRGKDSPLTRCRINLASAFAGNDGLDEIDREILASTDERLKIAQQQGRVRVNNS